MNNYTTMRRTENAFEKIRLPAAACSFSLQPSVALSRTVLRKTPITIPTTHYPNTCVKLTIVTHLSFSERIAIANLSFSHHVRRLFFQYRRKCQHCQINLAYRTIVSSVYRKRIQVRVQRFRIDSRRDLPRSHRNSDGLKSNAYGRARLTGFIRQRPYDTVPKNPPPNLSWPTELFGKARICTK